MECVGLKAPKEPSEPTPTAEWTVEAVCDWASAAGLPGPCVKSLRTECIDGAALLELSETDMQEHLKLPLGTRKQLVRERAKLPTLPRAGDGNGKAADNRDGEVEDIVLDGDDVELLEDLVNDDSKGSQDFRELKAFFEKESLETIKEVEDVGEDNIGAVIDTIKEEDIEDLDAETV